MVNRPALQTVLKRPWSWLLLAAFGFLLSQFSLMDPGRFYAWDEAIYVSEVSPHLDAIGMFAHRARGVTLLVAPILQVTESVVAVRSYMAVLSGIALGLSFLPWTRLYGWIGPLSAGLFASTWLTIAWSSEVMPNLYSALAAISGVGLSVLYVRSPSHRTLLGVFSAVFATGLIRPLDCAVLVAVIWFIAGARKRGIHRRLAGISLAGAGLAAIPWVIEAELRFEGVLNRLDLIREVVGGGPTNNLSEYLRLLAAPLRSGVTATTPTIVAAWLGLLITLTAAAIVLKRDDRVPPILVAGAAAAFAAPYLIFSEAASPRFMLPALGFLCIGTAMGLLKLGSMDRRRWVAVIASLSLVACALLNFQIANRWSTAQAEVRGISLTLGNLLAEVADRPCYFLSSHGYPRISVASKCPGGGLATDPSVNNELFARESAKGRSVHAFVLSGSPLKELGERWSCHRVARLPGTLWHHCTMDGST